jgi:hypothetical protein
MTALHTDDGGQVIDSAAMPKPNRLRPALCGLALAALLYAEWQAIDFLFSPLISQLWRSP